jgi:chromosome segregation ATPase
MLTPTEFELRHLYDPIKAHAYYLRTRQLKGRRRGSGVQPVGFARANARRSAEAKPKQRRELQARIRSLETKLQKLETKIRQMEAKEASEDRRGQAKKERAAKEREKPKTAAEKAEAAREAKKYRDKNQQQLQNKAKEASTTSGGGSSSKAKTKSSSKSSSLTELKALATKVRGQIAVAKQKLAAL